MTSVHSEMFSLKKSHQHKDVKGRHFSVTAIFGILPFVLIVERNLNEDISGFSIHVVYSNTLKSLESNFNFVNDFMHTFIPLQHRDMTCVETVPSWFLLKSKTFQFTCNMSCKLFWDVTLIAQT